MRPSIRCFVLCAGLLAGTSPLAGQARFNHDQFDRLLREHVTDGWVDYDAFHASREFQGYLTSLAAQDPSLLPLADRLAFWINGYNAFTIDLINRHQERRSIRAIRRPWSTRFVEIGGIRYSLDEIEHEIIRKQFDEPRIHFALVCAAKGCPPLRSEAYRGEALEQQLTEQTLAFLTRTPQKNRVDLATGTLHLSPIFRFRDYAKDFGGTREAIGRFVARYYRMAGHTGEAALLEGGAFRVRYTEYDWSLNSVRNR